MSTRSSILIQVPENFINTKAQYNKEMFEEREVFWKEEACPDKSEEILITKPYLGIYCHWDGYIAGVGQELVTHYSDFMSAFNLILGGDCSSIYGDQILRYATRQNEDWEYIQPKQLDEAWYVTDDSEYLYVFKNNHWYYVNSNEEWIELPDNDIDLESYILGYETALTTI